MKLLCFALALVAALAFDLNAPAVNMGLINKINQEQSDWVAGVNSYFVGRKLADVKNLMGTHVDPYIYHPHHYNNTDLPDTFDAATKWPKCPTMKKIYDQGECGSCWAISSAEVMSDRWCIATSAKETPEISTEDIVSCYDGWGTCKGCQGGNPQMVFMMYWPYEGAVTGGEYGAKSTCYPYEMPKCEHHTKGPLPPCNKTRDTPQCAKKCTGKGNYQNEKAKYKGKDSGTFKGENEIMNEIYNNGPVVCAIHVYEDFLNYKSGVYHHTGGGQELGGHAVRIMGWGVDKKSKQKFWRVANSWNEDWGDHGYVNILKGKDECGIESWLVTAGTKA